jgi:hypothetical protein
MAISSLQIPTAPRIPSTSSLRLKEHILIFKKFPGPLATFFLFLLSAFDNSCIQCKRKASARAVCTIRYY